MVVPEEAVGDRTVLVLVVTIEDADQGRIGEVVVELLGDEIGHDLLAEAGDQALTLQDRDRWGSPPSGRRKGREPALGEGAGSRWG